MRPHCTGKVYDTLGLAKYPCSRDGTIERNSKWWCWQHDPEAINKRRKKWQAKWATENRQSNEANRRLAAERLAVGFLSTDALDAGIVKARFTSHDRLINAARAAAVQLRDIGGATPAGRLGMFQPLLLEIARSLESALKEDPSDAT